MFISDVLKLLNITQSDLAGVFNVTPGAISKRVNSKSELKVSELLCLQEHYNIDLFGRYARSAAKIEGRIADAVEIVYWDSAASGFESSSVSSVIKRDEITSFWLDRELVHDVWEKDEKDLRILAMPGDNMNGGDAPIFNEDLLVIDTKSKEILRSGIYAYTTRAGVFVNNIRQKADGSIMFSHRNKQYTPATYSMKDLKAVDFEVIGRMIACMSALHD